MSSLEARLSQLSPKQRALLEERLALRLEAAREDGIEPQPLGDGCFPLSYSQSRLWFIDQMGQSSATYSISHAIRIRGRLELAVLFAALKAVVGRQECLRTRFTDRDGEGQAVVEPQVPLRLPVLDLSRVEPQVSARCRRLANLGCGRGFNLARAPLVRLWLQRTGDNEQVLVLVAHHIIADGWSMVVLIRDLTLEYIARLSARPSPLPPLSVQYRDFSAWQRRFLQGERLVGELAFWQAALAGAPDFVALPTDRTRPERESFEAQREGFEISAEVTARLAALGRGEGGATLFMALLAAFGLLMHHWARLSDLVVSGPISYRNRPELEGVFGFFANTLLYRLRILGEQPFRLLLREAASSVRSAYEHQHLPLERIIEQLAPNRTLRYTPFLQLGFNFIHHDLGGVEAKASLGAPQTSSSLGLEIEEMELDFANASYEQGWVLSYDGKALKGAVHFKRELYERGTIRRLIALFVQAVELAVVSPDLSIDELSELLTAAEEGRRRAARERLTEASLQGLRTMRRRSVPASDATQG